MTESFTFQAETQQLLDILIHSLYTDREIFLRELVSNASDALNRMQFERLTNDDVVDPEAELEIRIIPDEDAGTLTIRDTGIGMTRDEMIENLGTIARSGAKRFIEALKDAPSSDAVQNIIGQFGVGFYSVFMVADKVRVVSRSLQPDAEAVAWEAEGGTTYTVEAAEKATRGTDIIVYLKEDEKEFLQDFTISNVIKRHSDYVAFPIYVGDGEEAVNKQTAIWRQSPRETEADDYKQFYQMLTMDFNEPLHHIHMRADVPMQFYALLYVPGSAEQTMFNLRKEPGLKLYARKVMIQEYNKDLLPEYLSFIQGVVDSEDLPLNVSRESIKADRIIARLKSTITSKVMSEFKTLADDDREKYLKIHDAFGHFLKQGVAAVPQDRDDLLPLIYFHSSHEDSEDAYTSLDEYVERMVDGQEDIFYVVADDFNAAKRSPHLEPFRKRGIEVLYFSDPVDAMLPLGLTEYKEHKLRAVDESDIDLDNIGTSQDDTDDEQQPLTADDMEKLTERVKSVLGERISGVRSSKVLVGSAARLVSDEHDAGRHMYRIQRLLDREYELPVKTLELNPRHPLIHNLNNMLQGDSSNALVDVVIEQVFETALLQDGIHPDPASMADRMMLIMQAATGGAAPVANGGVSASTDDAESETETPSDGEES